MAELEIGGELRLLSLLLLFSGAGCTRVQLPELDRAPMTGLHEWHGGNTIPLPKPSTEKYARFVWKDLEDGNGKIDLSPIAKEVEAARAERRRFGFRVMSCWSDEGMEVPADVAATAGGFWFGKTYAPDWNSPAYIERVQRLVKALGEKFDGDPGVGWVDIGLYGNWGEWHVADFPYKENPGFAPGTLSTKKAIIDAYLSAFKKTRLIMMTDDLDGLAYALGQSPRVGLRRDSLGHAWFAEGLHSRPELEDLVLNRWRTAPFIAEFYAPSPDGMFALALSQVQEYHITSVGNGNTTKALAEMSEDERSDFTQIGRAAGAQLTLSYSTKRNGSKIELDLSVANGGNAPLYDKYVPIIRLRDRSGNVLAEQPIALDLSTILPNRSQSIHGSLNLPSSARAGIYDLVLELRDANNYLPPPPLAGGRGPAWGGTLLTSYHLSDGGT